MFSTPYSNTRNPFLFPAHQKSCHGFFIPQISFHTNRVIFFPRNRPCPKLSNIMRYYVVFSPGSSTHQVKIQYIIRTMLNSPVTRVAVRCAKHGRCPLSVVCSLLRLTWLPARSVYVCGLLRLGVWCLAGDQTESYLLTPRPTALYCCVV